MKRSCIWFISAILGVLVLGACQQCVQEPPSTGPFSNCKDILDADSIVIGQICFEPGEVITNTTEYTKRAERRLFKYLLRKGLTPVDTCRCEQKLIRWGSENPTQLDIIGTVADAPKTGGPQGDQVTMAGPNYRIVIPTPLDSIRNSDQQFPTFRTLPTDPFAHVVVIDTGVDTLGANLQNTTPGGFSHIPLTGGGQVCGNRAVDTRQGLDVTDLEKAVPHDWIGHGTHVSGIVVDAMTSNPDVRIQLRNVKVSEGNTTSIHLFHFLCGMYYALHVPPAPAVINVSLGWEDDRIPEVMRPILREMEAMGVLMVAGAGNYGVSDCNDASRLFWPAAFSTSSDRAGNKVVISVGAWDEYSCNLWYNSNQCFDLAAPGVNILSSYLHDPPNGKTGLASSSGTSMAAPYVSRMAARMFAQNPGIAPDQVKAQIIANTTLRPANTGTDPSLQVRVVNDPGIASKCGGN